MDRLKKPAIKTTHKHLYIFHLQNMAHKLELLEQIKSLIMFRQFFKSLFRNIWRNKLNSSINLLGLAIGIATSFLILSHVSDELSYDKFYPNAKRIYRVINQAHYGDQERNWAPTAPVLAEEMMNFFPEIEMATHFRQAGSMTMKYQPDEGEPKIFDEDWGFFSDSISIEMFGLDFLHGDKLTALRDINSIIVTQSFASKYFGKENPIGKTILLQSEFPVKVTGVFKDLPHNSHIKIDFLVTFETFKNFIIDMGYEELFNARTWAGVYTYVLLDKNNQKNQIESKMLDFEMEYYQFDISREEMAQQRMFSLQPLTDIHLHSNLEQEIRKNGNMVYVVVFTISAIFILLIAGVNFVNLTTSQSLKRMKEVGIKKVNGAFKGQLTRQFLNESVVQTVIAGLIGVLLIDFFIPLYNQLSGKEITLLQVFSPFNIVIMSLIIVGLGILSGIYPAFFVSSLDPVKSIKGLKDPQSRSNTLRKTLLVIQFVLAGFMIFSTLIVFLQMKFFESKELGFRKENLIAISIDGDLSRIIMNDPTALKSEIISHSSIIGVSFASNLPGEDTSVEGLRPDSLPNNMELPSLRFMRTDKDYLSTMDIDLIEGIDLKDISAEEHYYILNESAVEVLNLNQPIGTIGNSTFGGPGKIVGVAKNFHFESLHSEIEPLVLEYIPGPEGRQIGFAYCIVRFQPGQYNDAMLHLKKTIDRLAPESVFTTQLVESFMDKLYKDEANVLSLFKAFSFLSILIASLGLFGISAYTAALRTREIGIRKTFGAGVTSVTRLISSEFMIYVAISLLIALPLGYYIMNKWLQNFAFHIDIKWWVIILSGIITIFVALVAVSYQAISAARTNPAVALRHE